MRTLPIGRARVMRLSISGFNGMAGTGFGTLAAFDTLVIVDDGQIVLHGDGARRARPCAFAAGNTAEFTGIHHRLAALVRRAGDIHLCVGGNTRKELFGTGEDAGSAGNALIRVHICTSIGKGDGVFGAYARAVSVAQAAVFAHLAPAGKLVFLGAVLCAAVFERVLGMNAARTAADAHGGLCRGERHAEHVGDRLFFARFRHMAVGKFGFALCKLFGKPRTARTAAAAAVGARKV